MRHFLIQVKTSGKATETTCNINTAFGPGTANECTVQWWFKKFCKGEESLEDEERGSEVDNGQLRAINKSDPFPSTQEVAEELNIDDFTVIRYLKQIGKVGKLGKWVSCELTENKKQIVILKCPLILDNNSEPFLNQIVSWVEKWILYDNQQ